MQPPIKVSLRCKALITMYCLTLGVALAGCAGVLDKASEFNEATHDAAELQMCKGYELGIPPMRYQGDGVLLAAWAVICSTRLQRMADAQAAAIQGTLEDINGGSG